MIPWCLSGPLSLIQLEFCAGIWAITQVDAIDRTVAETFLRINMPLQDTLNLSEDFIARNIDSALTARAVSSLEDVPDDIFLDYVLPYSRLVPHLSPIRVSFLLKCPTQKPCTVHHISLTTYIANVSEQCQFFFFTAKAPLARST